MKAVKTGYDVLCVGACGQDILIEGMKESGFQNHMNILRGAVFTSGGDATNEAVVLSRLGNKTALIAKVDDGPVGNAILMDLQKEGVDISQIKQDSDCKSSTAFIAINENREHTFFLAKGENEGIAFEEMDEHLLEKAKAICLGSLYTCHKLDRGGSVKLMKRARELGVMTFADVDSDIENLGPEAMNEVYPYMDYLLPSIDEANYITGKQNEKEAAEELRNRGVRNVIIKLGDRGCYVCGEREEFYVNPFEVDVKDTTGCGDNFAAGFIHSILAGKSLYDSALFACAAGAVNSMETGGHMGVKSLEQVENFMANSRQKIICRT